MLFFGDCCGLVDFSFFKRVLNHIYIAVANSLVHVGKKNVACNIDYGKLLKSLKRLGHSINLMIRGSLPLTVSHSKMVKGFMNRMIFSGINRAWPIRPKDDAAIRELLDRVGYHKTETTVYERQRQSFLPLTRKICKSFERPEDLQGQTGALEGELRAYMKDLRKYLTPEDLGRIRQSVKPSFNISGCIELPRSKGGAYEYYRQKIIAERQEKVNTATLVNDQPRENVETRRWTHKNARHSKDPCLTQFGQKCQTHPEIEPLKIDWNLFEMEAQDVENNDITTVTTTQRIFVPGTLQNSRREAQVKIKSENLISSNSIWAQSEDRREDVVFLRRLGKILSGTCCNSSIISADGRFETKRRTDKIDSVTKGDWWQAVMNEATTRHIDLRLVPELIAERGGKFRIVTKANAVCPSILGSAHYKCNELLKKIPGIREGFELRKKSPTSQELGCDEILRRIGKRCNNSTGLEHEKFYESDCTDSTDYIDPRYARIVLEELCSLLNIKGVERDWAFATIDVSGRRYIEIVDKNPITVEKRVFIPPEDVYVTELDDIDDTVGMGKRKINRESTHNLFGANSEHNYNIDANVQNSSKFLSGKLQVRPKDPLEAVKPPKSNVGRLLAYTDEDGLHQYWIPSNLTLQDYLTLDEVRLIPSDANNVYEVTRYKPGTSILMPFQQRIAERGRIPDQIKKSWVSVTITGTNSESLRQIGVIPMRQRIEIREGREVLVSHYAVARGTQMGLRLSFPILCLLHHFATRSSNDSVVFGDDILARWNETKIADYESRMKELGFVLNQSKTFRSSRVGLFCGLFFDFRNNRRIKFPDVKSLVTGKVEKSLDNASPELLLKEVHNLCYMDSRGRIRDNVVRSTNTYFSKILRSINSLLPSNIPEEYGGFGMLPYNRFGSELTNRLIEIYDNVSEDDKEELISQIRSNWSSTRHSVEIRNLMAIVKSSLRNLSTPNTVGYEEQEISLNPENRSAKPVFKIPVGERPLAKDVEGELEAHIMSEMQYYTDDGFSKLNIERYNVRHVVKRVLTTIGHGMDKFKGHSTKPTSNDECYYAASRLNKLRLDLHKYLHRLTTRDLYIPLDQAYYISQLMDMPVSDIIEYLASYSGIELLKNRLILSLTVDFNRSQARKLAKAKKQEWLDKLVKKINSAYGFGPEAELTVEDVWESIPFDIRSDVVDNQRGEEDLQFADETEFPSLLSDTSNGPFLPENANWIHDRNATNVGKSWAQQFIVTPKLPKIEVSSNSRYVSISDYLSNTHRAPPKADLVYLDKNKSDKKIVLKWEELDYEDYQTTSVQNVIAPLEKALSSSVSMLTDDENKPELKKDEVIRRFTSVLKSSLVESLVNFNATTARSATLIHDTDPLQTPIGSGIEPPLPGPAIQGESFGSQLTQGDPFISIDESYVEKEYVYQPPHYEDVTDYLELGRSIFGREWMNELTFGILNDTYRRVKEGHPELNSSSQIRNYAAYEELCRRNVI